MIDLAKVRGTANEIPPEVRIAKAISRLADQQRFDRRFPLLLQQRNMKACIECAEYIKHAAKRCHFCGAVQPLNTGENTSPTEPT
jgi:hypothetical protein